MEGLHEKLSSEIHEWLIASRNIYLVVTNNVGDILFANEYYKENFIVPQENSPSLNFASVLHPSDVPAMKNGLLTCNKNGSKSPQTIINRNKQKDSSGYKSIKWEFNILESAHYEEPLLVHLGHDLVMIEHQSDFNNKTNKSLNELIDDLQIGVIIQDGDSSILLSNKKAEQLLGVSKSDLAGRTVYDKEWKIIREDGSEFKPEEFPTAQAIATKKYIHEVMMGVYNYEKERYLWFLVDANPDLNDQGEVQRVVTTFIDVSERVKAENDIKKQQQQLQIMMDHAPMVIFLKDVEGKYIFFNHLYKSFLGKDLQPGITDYDIFEKDFADWCKSKDREVIENDKTINFEHRVEGQIFHETKFPVKDDNGKVYAVGGFSQNITKQKEEEEQLRLLESVITSTKDAVLITEAEPIDKPGPRIVYANQAFYDLSGYTKVEVIGNHPRFLQGENTDRTELDRLRKALENWESCEVQLINYKKSGEEFWVNFTVVPVADKKGIYTHWISVQQDITKRVGQEKILKNALKEKTTLLAEIHHRVKNNLAIVSGLLELQSMEVEETSALPLKRSINRIQSIAMVHELMYQTEQLSSVNIKNYLSKLIPGIQRTLQSGEKIKINLDIAQFEVNINQAIPLGLLMNELLTNSYKYAFKGGGYGQIDIIMESRDDKLTFHYKDSGPGFTDGNDFSDGSSLGLSLINAQLEQLHADFDVKTDGCFELTFSFSISQRGPHSNIS